MQNVLCIDVSTEPAQAIVVALDGTSVNVVEQRSAFLGDTLSRNHMLSKPESAAAMEAGEQDAAQPQETPQDEDSNKKNGSPSVSTPFANLLSHIETSWTEGVLIVPPYDYLSLSVELPFNDAKSINKVIDLEVQDQVPFEIEDFIVSHRAVAAANSQEIPPRYDVHVGIIPRVYVQNLLALCKTAAFEPMVITTPTGVLSAPYHLAQTFFAEDSAILYECESAYFLATRLAGQFRADRTFSRIDYMFSSNGTPHASALDEAQRLLLTDLKLALTSAERRYRKTFDRIYYVGNSSSLTGLQQSLGRPIERIDLSEFVKIDDQRGSLAALSSLFVRDVQPAPVLNNFRVREFSYSPQLKELYRGGKAVAPYLLTLLGCFIIYLGLSYLLNYFHMRRLNYAMYEQVARVFPDTKIEFGKEFDVLQTEVGKMRQQLEDVAMISALSPLDILAELAKIMPTDADVSFKSLKIRDNKFVISGSAQEYTKIAKIESILKSSKLFKRVKLGEGSGPSGIGGARNFSFEVWTDEA